MDVREMDIRKYRLLRQQQRENEQTGSPEQSPSPSPSPTTPPPSNTRTTPGTSNATNMPPRRPTRFSKFMGRKTKPTHSNYDEEIEMASLMPGEHGLSGDDHHEEDLDDYGPKFSKSSKLMPPNGSMKNGPAFQPSIFFNILRNYTRLACRSPFAVPSFVLFVVSILFIVLIANRASIFILSLRIMHVPPGVYSREGKLYVGKDTRFFIKGVSWFGMEEKEHIPCGLDKVSIDQVFDFLKEHNFNAIRLPLSLENLKANAPTSYRISTFHNPELPSKRYFEVIRTIVRKAADKHILVLLDMHRLHNEDVRSEGYWYKKDVHPSELEKMWIKLATEFADEWNILGADLINEPWASSWNDKADDPQNWKNAAEALSNTIHKLCPSWLLFIEGVGNPAGKCKGCFWSENLRVIQDIPPRVNRMSKIVLSPHVYGPGVFMQDYFKTDNFTEKMPQIWDQHFGQCSNVTGIATVIGEWGGTFDEQNQDANWQRKFFSYIKEKELSFFYWCLNPESEDTGGLLQADWKTPVSSKLSLISSAPSTNVEDYKDHFVRFREI